MLIHQSLIADWAWCPQRVVLSQRVTAGRRMTSYLAFGSVMHHALQVLERYRDLDKALDTFRWFWHPHNVEQITGAPIPHDGWGRGHSYGRLLQRGVKVLQQWHDLLRFDESELLALEYEFIVPIEGTPHFLGGTMDRLSARWAKRIPILDIEDFKTGRQKWGLRHNLQGSGYAYATTRPEFWMGFQGEIDGRHYDTTGESFGQERGAELFERFQGKARHFTWIDLNGRSIKRVDGGYRGQLDYDRFALAVTEVVRSLEAGIYPLRIDGETCGICEFAGICGGGLPDEDYGRPA